MYTPKQKEKNEISKRELESCLTAVVRTHFTKTQIG